VLTLVLLAAGFAAAQDDRMVPVTDLKMVSGEWKGTLAGVRGGQVPYSLVIHADGSWRGESPNGATNGTMRIDNGVIRFQSATSGRTGTYTLYDASGKRVLRMQGEGGVSAELRRP
jgi:hypothetical protein